MREDSARRPLKTLLVATDFSPSAALAIERVAKLPLAPGATVHLVHVVPKLMPARVRPSVWADAEEALGRAAAALDEAVKAASPIDTVIALEVAQGQPYVELIRAARRRGAELIVMGRHGKHSLKERFVGKTTERVVRHGDLPSLIVTSKRLSPYSVPMVAVDLADEIPVIQGLVDLTLKLIAPESHGVTLLHAFQAPFETRMRPVLPHEDFVNYRREYKRAAVQDFARLQAEVEAPNVAIRTLLSSGDPREIIAREVRRRSADLLVLGTHGRTGIAHALLGSVAESTMARALCDVAIQRPQGFRFEAP